MSILLDTIATEKEIVKKFFSFSSKKSKIALQCFAANFLFHGLINGDFDELLFRSTAL